MLKNQSTQDIITALSQDLKKSLGDIKKITGGAYKDGRENIFFAKVDGPE